MLLELADWMARHFTALHLFQYITFRTIMAALTALAMSLLCGPWLINRLAALKAGQVVRSDGPQTHLVKAGTPTMGGVMILLSVSVATLLWADLRNRYVWVVLAVMLAYGAIGFYDDYRKLVLKDSRGLASRWKYFWQSVFGLGAALFLYCSAPAAVAGLPVAETALYVPLFKHVVLPLGLLFVVVTYFMIVGFSNAVNLTDGLDGLVIMPVVLVGASLGVFAYVMGSSVYSKYLLFPHIAGAGELLIFCSAMGGAGLAFLWYNTHPAQMFMGDVGALALGGALGTIAVIVRQEIVLFIMGGIFVAETLSVMLQVMWFKFTKRRFGEGRRLFKMAPLHHHFELSGWKETQVVVRFWIITLMLCLFGLSTLKLR